MKVRDLDTEAAKRSLAKTLNDYFDFVDSRLNPYEKNQDLEDFKKCIFNTKMLFNKLMDNWVSGEYNERL